MLGSVKITRLVAAIPSMEGADFLKEGGRMGSELRKSLLVQVRKGVDFHEG